MVSAEGLERLMATAAMNPWSAVGRPDWFARVRDNVRNIMLVILGVEHSSVYRCIATVVLKDSSGGRFTLDVAFTDFDALPEAAFRDLVSFSHQYLVGFPYLKLDPSQEESSRRLENERRRRPRDGQ